MEHQRRDKVSVVGLGKLGLPLAAVLASKSELVTIYDRNPQILEILEQGNCPIEEQGLESLLKQNRQSIRVERSYPALVENSDTTFIIVPTPSCGDGTFSLDYVEQVFQELGAALKNKKSYHLIVLCSTVNPGDFEKSLKQCLEQACGKKLGPTLGYCYQPLFIALGSVIQNILQPDFVLIGQSDPDAGAVLNRYYKRVLGEATQVLNVRVSEAELAKIAINSFVTTKISFANFLARLCEKLPGANVDEVTAVVGSDSRVGKKYLKGGTSFGGPCFPRDNQAFAAFAKSVDMLNPLPQATIEINQQENRHLLELVNRSRRSDQDGVGVLGVSYKPGTYVVEESAGLYLIQGVIKQGHPVCAFDPALNNQNFVLKGVDLKNTLEECVNAVDILVLTSDSKEYASVFQKIKNSQRKPHTVIDCWRVFAQEDWKDIAEYTALGIYNANSKVTL